MAADTFLVTGAAGFLGGHLARALLADGAAVRVLTRRPQACDDLVEAGAGLVEGDLSDPAVARCAVAGISAVFNCAAAVADWGRPATFLRDNVDSLKALLQASRDADVRRLLHVSSTDVYGYPGRPTTEDAPLIRCGESYADSKIEAEEVLRDWAASGHGPSIKIIRPASIYGPGRSALVTEAVELSQWPVIPMFGGESVVAGLVHVDDVVRAMRVVMGSEGAFDVYNIGGDATVTWRQFLYGIASEMGHRARSIPIGEKTGLSLARFAQWVWRKASIEARPPLTVTMIYLAARNQLFPSDRIQQDLGFSPSVEFHDGLKRLSDALRKGQCQ